MSSSTFYTTYMYTTYTQTTTHNINNISQTFFLTVRKKLSRSRRARVRRFSSSTISAAALPILLVRHSTALTHNLLHDYFQWC